MIKIYDEYDLRLDGGFFSSPKKNLGNKLFIYAASRIISDLLNYELICPNNALIRRENTISCTYENNIFPFSGKLGISITDKIKIIGDSDILNLGSIDELINTYPNYGFINMAYFSKYNYIKPYKNLIKKFYNKITKPNQNNNNLIIMLRDSNVDGSFKLPNSYYLDLISNETFDELYISFDHKNNHIELLNELNIFNPIIIDGNILDVFSEITSFNKIIAAQGTFSFWACFLSSAEKIYWPITNSGPNSNNLNPKSHINLIVDDESRYQLVYVSN